MYRVEFEVLHVVFECHFVVFDFRKVYFLVRLRLLKNLLITEDLQIQRARENVPD